ncbi:MAG: hypothetical protein AAFQ66_20810 [Pseudomonadota bacterium]
MRFKLAILAVLALSACDPILVEDPAVGGDPNEPLLLADGIYVPATDQAIGFGRDQAGAIASMTRLFGEPVRERTATCGGSTVNQVFWGGGLVTNFVGGAFQGWQVVESGGVTVDQAGIICLA